MVAVVFSTPDRRVCNRYMAEVADTPGTINSDAITGPYPDFARLVRGITGTASSRGVAIRSGVSHNTITRMWNGEKVGDDLIRKFATAYQTDPLPLLRAAGHVVVLREAAPPYPDGAGELPPEIIARFADVIRPLPPEDWDAALDALEAVARAQMAARASAGKR